MTQGQMPPIPQPQPQAPYGHPQYAQQAPSAPGYAGPTTQGAQPYAGQGYAHPHYADPNVANPNAADPNHPDPTIDPASRTPVGHNGIRVDISERRAWAMNGFAALIGAVFLTFVAIIVAASGAPSEAGGDSNGGLYFLGGLIFVVALVLARPLIVVQPGQTRVIQFFGRYIGTVRRTGLTWVAPFTTRRKVSVRVNNFETNSLKVNDADGNPVEIGAIVVWQVADTARASFAVEDYVNFVAVQSESALRHVTTSHPYDDHKGGATTLRGSTDIVSAELATEVALRVAAAGVEIIEVRISHLAYAPEIAQAMLQRQQATAIVAARETIVEGAVGMVEMALDRLNERGVVELDEERKATMVSNLLVVLCGDQRVSPVVNTGSLYH